MCERDGYTKLSIRSLAKESNVSQTAPYRHFKTKEDLYAEVAIEGFNKIHKAISKYDSNDSKRNLIDGAKAYIKFGLKNANTYDLMFGTAIKDFTKYPMLFEAANKTYLHIRSTFKEFSKNKDDLYIEESCIDIWAKIHGMVGLLRKLEVVPVKLVEMPDTPFKAINLISKDLDSYLEKFFNKF
jgi:AcrR family transcriptional regulator